MEIYSLVHGKKTIGEKCTSGNLAVCAKLNGWSSEAVHSVALN